LSVIGFDHFNIRAPRPLLDAVRDFYVDNLGLTVGARPAVRSHGYWLYLSEQPVVHLMEWTDVPDGVGSLPGYLDHVAFSCDDLEGMIKKLIASGVDFNRRELSHEGVVITQLKMCDPTGNVVELNCRAGSDK
jgi:catechol 2,3-dioxygenase-like lactoylglutathione lyase family enzyme